MLAHTEWLDWSPGTFAAVMLGAFAVLAVAMWLDSINKRRHAKRPNGRRQ